MDRWTVVLRLTGLGWYVAFSIITGILGGIGLDKLLGTVPLFTIIGTVLGSVVAFWGMYRMIHPILYGKTAGKTTRKANRDRDRKGS